LRKYLRFGPGLDQRW